MEPPEGFVDPDWPHYVCKLVKALYGLKQAPRAWFDRLRSVLLSWGFANSKSDISLFIYSDQSQILMILINADDVLVTGSNAYSLKCLTEKLHSIFSLKDLGSLLDLRYGIHIRPSALLDIVVYSNVDWVSCPDNRRSVGAYCVFLGESLVTWSSKKQKAVARSTTESEYRSLAHTAAELCWVKSLLIELHLWLKRMPVIWCDNTSAAALASNPVHHARTNTLKLMLIL